MTLINTLNHILQHYLRVFLDAFSYNSPKSVQTFRKDCESLVERYNSLLKDINQLEILIKKNFIEVICCSFNKINF